MELIDILTDFFSRSEEQTVDEAPEGVCELCWGYEEYDGKIRILFKDKQIDVNNHKARYMFIRDFVVNHIDGIKLKEGLIKVCEKCKNNQQ